MYVRSTRRWIEMKLNKKDSEIKAVTMDVIQMRDIRNANQFFVGNLLWKLLFWKIEKSVGGFSWDGP
jgi:hypothetical protein